MNIVDKVTECKDDKIDSYLQNKTNNYYELSEEDFYPPSDDRTISSGIDDIDGGDNFYDYAKYFFDEYGEYLFDSIN